MLQLTCISKKIMSWNPKASDRQHGVDGHRETNVRDSKCNKQNVSGSVKKSQFVFLLKGNHFKNQN